MYSWLVTVLLLASAAYCSGGARVPITRYTCTQPDYLRIPYNDTNQCNVSRGLRTCETKGGVHPDLLNGYTTRAGVYSWSKVANPFVLLDIPQGWCVGSVKMTFLFNEIPTLSLSVHSSERLSNNTDRTMFSNVSNEGIHTSRQVVMNLTTLACRKYLRVNMTTHQGRIILLAEVEVFDTGNITSTPFSASGSPTLSAIIAPTSSKPGIITFTPPFSVSGRPTTTTIHSSSFTITPMSSQPSTSDTSTTSGPLKPTHSPSIPHSDVPVDQDNYVLPAAISIVAVLLVVVLIAVFVVVICIVTRRHKTRKSVKVQHLPILYQSTQSDVTFKDSQFLVGQSAVPTHDTNGASDKSHDDEIRGTNRNYTNLGPSESNNSNVVQGATGEPVAEGDVTRPASQASIHSSEVSSKPTHDVFPSMLEQPFPIPASDEGGHHKVAPHWQPEGLYELAPDFQLPDKVATTDNNHKVLKDAEDATGSQGGTSSRPFPQAPCSAFPIVDSVYDTIDEAPDKMSEPDPSTSTYASVDPPSSSPMPAAAQPSKHSCPPKPPHSAKSPSVPQEDHIYSIVDKSHKKSISSTKSPPVGITHSTNSTHVHSEVDVLRKVDETNASSCALDVDLCGGMGNPVEDLSTQPKSITSSAIAKGTVPTEEVAMCTIYTEVDYSKKKSRRGEES